MFTGKEEHGVSLDQASRLTKRYRDSKSANAIKGGFISRNVLEKILAQKECVGIRMYFAFHEDGNPTVVLVGVKPNEDDIFDGVLGEEWIPCPPNCSAKNPLNS